MASSTVPGAPVRDEMAKLAEPGALRRRDDGGRSRATAAVRLAVAVWLMWGAVVVLASPEAITAIAAARGAPPETVLRLAGLHFTLGMFLLSGFMSRVAGLVLAASAVWQLALIAGGVGELLQGAIGLYLMLRGGGTWAMDVYVQKMQDRIRTKEAAKTPALPDRDG